MPCDSPPIMHDAFLQLSKMLFGGWFSYFVCCHARSVRWFGGIVVRGCMSSLLGSYIHQELI